MKQNSREKRKNAISTSSIDLRRGSKAFSNKFLNSSGSSLDCWASRACKGLRWLQFAQTRIAQLCDEDFPSYQHIGRFLCLCEIEEVSIYASRQQLTKLAAQHQANCSFEWRYETAIICTIFGWWTMLWIRTSVSMTVWRHLVFRIFNMLHCNFGSDPHAPVHDTKGTSAKFIFRWKLISSFSTTGSGVTFDLALVSDETRGGPKSLKL